jgi:putative phosphoserine phosphatase/1-acylglycerol-3-phosphate O-acyltransferase
MAFTEMRSGTVPERPPRRRGAFFDVDGTLVHGMSVGWTAEALVREGCDARFVSEYERVHRLVVEGGADVGTLTVEGFRLFAGRSWQDLLELGERWFRTEGRSRLRTETVRRLDEHQAVDDVVVLVSGSWLPSLAPLAALLRVEHILCSEVVVERGTVTGATAHAMVEAAKAEAVRDFALANDLDLSESWAYGDHPTDELVLETVGYPVVVGDRPELMRIAAERGWPRLEETAPVTRRP